MDWLEVSVATDGEAAEAVAEALKPFAFQGSVVLEQLGAEANPQADAVEPVVTVKIYLPESEATPARRGRIEEILYYLGRLYPIPQPRFRRLEERDWANAWKSHYRPFRIGKRICIRPSWLNQSESAFTGSEDVVIMLDPGMAFGTGLHPTTQMCLQTLESLIRPNVSVLDVGTGSGILAIAASKLGAGKVWGVDTDAVAVRTARENTAQNLLTGKVQFRHGTLRDVASGRWDLVLVNILAPVIITLLKEGGLMSYLATNGRMVLSGIIEQQAAEVESTIESVGGKVFERLLVRDWVTYVVGSAPEEKAR